MTYSRVKEIDGIRINPIKSVADRRGTFVKLHPLKEIHDQLDSVALSFNPSIGTVRGLHFQVDPFSEEKLVTCVQGSIFDVVVDLRPRSRTFGKWTSYELSDSNSLQLYLPKGIAHGFQTLTPNVIVHYCLTSQFSAISSYAIDPFGDLDISWPLETQMISDRDNGGITFLEAAQKYSESLKFPQE
jgi:dTDP-4-dehydrorhamnose 3,5-epimerase